MRAACTPPNLGPDAERGSEDSDTEEVALQKLSVATGVHRSSAAKHLRRHRQRDVNTRAGNADDSVTPDDVLPNSWQTGIKFGRTYHGNQKEHKPAATGRQDGWSVTYVEKGKKWKCLPPGGTPTFYQ